MVCSGYAQAIINAIRKRVLFGLEQFQGKYGIVEVIIEANVTAVFIVPEKDKIIDGQPCARYTRKQTQETCILHVSDLFDEFRRYWYVLDFRDFCQIVARIKNIRVAAYCRRDFEN